MSSFCDFRKILFCDFTAFSPFWRKQTFAFQMCLLKSTLAYQMCPNMINFDVVDFSEFRSEEVMFLLKLSV